MKDIQRVMFEKFSKNDYGRILLRYATILIYISIGYGLLDMIPMPGFINTILNYTYRIIYFGYILGLIGCFAKRDFLPIAGAFLFEALTSLISFIRWFQFNSVVNIVVYGFLGYFAFTCFTKEKANDNIPNVNGKRFCPNCGQEIAADVPFCDNCGNRF